MVLGTRHRGFKSSPRSVARKQKVSPCASGPLWLPSRYTSTNDAHRPDSVSAPVSALKAGSGRAGAPGDRGHDT